MTVPPLIYGLLPSIYRKRDAEGDSALLALAELLDETRGTVELDMHALYRDWFAETCASRALPYIARLAGLDGPPELAADPRALVVDAVALARRKGTFPAAEHGLAALSGWPIQLEFSAGTATVRYWPEPAYAVAQVAPHPWEPGAWHFHPMGIDTPLFAPPRSFPGIAAPFVPALDSPVALTLEAGKEDLARAFEICVEGEHGRLQPIPAADIIVADLTDWRTPGARSARAVVDPTLGRFLLLERDGRGRRVTVGFGYASAGNVGGGGYEREMGKADERTWVAYVHADAVPGKSKTAFRTLAEALEAWRGVRMPGLIRILDGSACDVDGMTIGEAPMVCPDAPNEARRLTIEALSGETPSLRGVLRVVGLGTGLVLVLNGFWIDGRLRLEGQVDARLEHCSLHAVTARRVADDDSGPIAAIETIAADGASPKVSLYACLVGPLALAGGQLLAVESVVDGGADGMAILGSPEATIVRATLIGGAELAALDALDSILGSPVDLTGAGGANVRFCFVPEGVDLSGVSDSVTGQPIPPFESLVFGRPGYARPDPRRSEGIAGWSDAIFTGASNGSEIGVFNAERAAQREDLLAAALPQALPVGRDWIFDRKTLAGELPE